jgi:high-affinity iron transporter
MRRTATAAVIASALAGGVAVAVAPAAAHGRAGSRPGVESISFGDVTCAPGWPAPEPGQDRFAVANRSSKVATAYLFRADSGAIVATLRRLGPGTVRAVSATLTAGRPYAWGCDLAGYPRHISEAQRALAQRQPGGNGPVVVPVATEQLAGPLRVYRQYVASRIARLRGQVAAGGTSWRCRAFAAAPTGSAAACSTLSGCGSRGRSARIRRPARR